MITPPERVQPQLLRLEILERLPRPALSRDVDVAAQGWPWEEGSAIAFRLVAVLDRERLAEMVSGMLDGKRRELASLLDLSGYGQPQSRRLAASAVRSSSSAISDLSSGSG